MKNYVSQIQTRLGQYWMLCLLICFGKVASVYAQTQICPTNQITNYSFENGVPNIAKTIAGSNATLNDKNNGFGVTDIGTDEGPDISYWIDASSNGGKGSINGNYLIWFNTPAAGNTNKCIQTNVDHYQFVKGLCYTICYKVAAFDPSNLNAGTTALIELDPVASGWNPTYTAGGYVVSNNQYAYSVGWDLPAPSAPKDINGNPYTGASGQVLDWKTLDWKTVCINVTPTSDGTLDPVYFSVYGEPATGITKGIAIDDISICTGCSIACVTPSSIQLTKTAPTCTGSTSNNNGKITLTSASNTDKCGISAAGAATYNGPAYASATAYVANKDVKTAIPNTGGTYILRLFNGSDNCYKDTTITVAVVTCAAVDCNCTNNLITTPSFEGSDLSAWTQATNDPGGTILFSNDNPYAVCGSWYGYVRSANADAYNASVYQNVNTTAGTSFTLNVYAGTHDPGQDSQIRLQFFNASNTLLSGGQTVQVDTDVDVSPFTLGKYTLTGTAPSGTAYVRVTFYTQGTYTGDNMAFKFDQVCLQATACTQPSAVTLTKTAPTCTGSTSNNNGKITLTSASNTDKCGISAAGAATYNGPAYATATAYVANKDVKTAIPNTGGTYILRLFNGSDNCYKDTTITVAAVTCNASCSIDITSATPSACSPSTNQYSLTVVVTYSNPPTGNIEISTSAGPNMSVAQTGSPQTVTLTGFTSNGAPNVNVSAAFVNNNTCSVTKLGIYNAPSSCSSPCNAPDCLGVTVKKK